MSPDEQRARAAAFLRAIPLRLAHRTEVFPWDVALFEPRLPNVWHLNSVWVCAIPDAVSVTAFVAEQEHLQGRVGLGHRQAAIADEATGDRIAQPLRGLGWRVTRDILMMMTWRRPPDRPTYAQRVLEVEPSGARTFTMHMLRNSPEGFSKQVIEGLAAVKMLLAQGGARFLGAVIDDKSSRSASSTPTARRHGSERSRRFRSIDTGVLPGPFWAARSSSTCHSTSIPSATWTNSPCKSQACRSMGPRRLSIVQAP